VVRVRILKYKDLEGEGRPSQRKKSIGNFKTQGHNVPDMGMHAPEEIFPPKDRCAEYVARDGPTSRSHLAWPGLLQNWKGNSGDRL
jgi:hypothetical protein